MSAASTTGPLARGSARAVVALRLLIVVAWAVGAVLAWTQLPALGGDAAAPLGDIVPADAKALVAEEHAVKLFGAPATSDTIVVQRNPKGLASDEIAATLEAANRVRSDRNPDRPLLGALPLVNGKAPGVTWGERGTTIVSFLFARPELNLVERQDAARAFIAALRPAPGSRLGVSGAAPARLQQFSEIEDILPWIEAVTVAVVLLVVALYFRSLGAPLVTLGTAALAYVIAVRVLACAGEQAGVTVPQEIEPLLVVLLLGLVTDYSVFFLSEGRRRLLAGEQRLPAARSAAARIGPTVLTAGLIVTACSAALLAGRLEFFRVFGPGLALCALVVTLVSVTLVPALLGLLGPWLFGKRVRHATPAVPEGDTGEFVAVDAPLARSPERQARWRRRLAGPLGATRAARRTARQEGRSTTMALGARMLAARPVSALVVLLVVVGLGWAASHAREIDLGVSFTRSLPTDAEPRVAGDDASRGFAAGVVAPTDVVLEQPGIGGRHAELARLQRAVRAQRGVAAVLGPEEQRIALANDPSLPRLLAREDGAAVRLVTVFRQDPTSAAAIADFKRLRGRLPGLLRQAGLPAGVRTSYGGETALADETVDAVVNDLGRIGIAVALVTFVLLVVFLRALVAPLLLLAAGLLGYLAALGLTSLAARELLGGTQLTYYVPLVGAVLLVALGSDYNVLIAGRIRAEAQRRRMREAVAVAAPQASRAITVAGLTLAATFALLGIVPLRSFRELAMLLTIGVLVDALVVRPALIPALLSLFGNASWWPGTARRTADEDVLLERVAARRGSSSQHARRATDATLRTLGERIGDRQARELARHLPEALRAPLADPEGCEPFGAAEFVDRVARRMQTGPVEAQADAMVVLETIAGGMPETEWDYVRAGLTEDYDVLLDPIAPQPGVVV